MLSDVLTLPEEGRPKYIAKCNVLGLDTWEKNYYLTQVSRFKGAIAARTQGPVNAHHG